MKPLLTLCLAAAPTLLAQAQATGRVAGQLLDAQHQPLPFATVLLQPLPDTTAVRATQAGADGRYAFAGVGAGRYCVVALPAGYQRQRSAPFELTASRPSAQLATMQLRPAAHQLARFSTAYQFEQCLAPGLPELTGLFVVPSTLQVLLEKVVKHNRGDEDAPLLVALAVCPATLSVRHRRAPKRTAIESMGTGLSNLRERYRLQAEEGLVFAIDQQGSRYPLAGTLTELEKQLDPARFFRLNRGELVNLSYIEKAEPYGKDRLAIKLKNSPDFLLTSAANTAEFRRWLDA